MFFLTLPSTPAHTAQQPSLLLRVRVINDCSPLWCFCPDHHYQHEDLPSRPPPPPLDGDRRQQGRRSDSIVDISKFIKTFSPKFISGNGEAPEIPKVDKLARSEFDTGKELDSKYINHMDPHRC